MFITAYNVVISLLLTQHVGGTRSKDVPFVRRIIEVMATFDEAVTVQDVSNLRPDQCT